MRRERRRLGEMKDWERVTEGEHEETEGTFQRERIGGDSREKMMGEPAWGDERVGESLRVLCKKIERIILGIKGEIS